MIDSAVDKVCFLRNGLLPRLNTNPREAHNSLFLKEKNVTGKLQTKFVIGWYLELLNRIRNLSVENSVSYKRDVLLSMCVCPRREYIQQPTLPNWVPADLKIIV